jgi:hypothetical protein
MRTKIKKGGGLLMMKTVLGQLKSAAIIVKNV